MIQLFSEAAGIELAKKAEYNVLTEAQEVFDERYAQRPGCEALAEMLSSSDEKVQWRAAVTINAMKQQEAFLAKAVTSWGESTVISKLGDIAPRLIDIIRVAYPNSIMHVLAQVQPMTNLTGQILVVKPQFGTTGAGVEAGDEVFANQTDGTYASDWFTDTVSSGDGSTLAFTKTLTYEPIKTSSVSIKVAGTEVATDNGTGGITGTTVTASTIDYTTGAMVLTFTGGNAPTAGQAITAEYRADIESASENYLREIDLGISIISVTAKEHPLRLKWSEQARLVAQATIGADIDSIITKVAGTFLKVEKDRVCINAIRNAAGAYDTDLTFDASVSGDTTKREHYMDFEITLEKAANKIFAASGRGEVSWVVAGTDAHVVIRSQSGYIPEANVVPIGAHITGYINGVTPVIKDPGLTSTEYITGFNGALVGDAGLIVADWIPVYFTPALVTSDLKGQKAMLSMYDIVVNNSDYYKRARITNI